MKYSLTFLLILNFYGCGGKTYIEPSNSQFETLRNCEVEEITRQKTFEINCNMSLTSSQAVVSRSFEQAAAVAHGYHKPFFKVIKNREKVVEDGPKVTGLTTSSGFANVSAVMTIELLDKKEDGVRSYDVSEYY